MNIRMIFLCLLFTIRNYIQTKLRHSLPEELTANSNQDRLKIVKLSYFEISMSLRKYRFTFAAYRGLLDKTTRENIFKVVIFVYLNSVFSVL